MKAVILAGGKGTRLGKLTQDIPKPMIPVAGKPLLEYQVELCRRYHIEEVILLVNHLSESIYNYFKDGRKFGISISYYEEQQPLGTVGGVKELEDRLDSDFLVLYGDVMMEMDLRRLIDFHHTNEDTAIAIGEAISQALGDRAGITRYGDVRIPMDETLTRVTLDVSNRPYLIWQVEFTRPKLGEMDTELFKEWFQGFSQAAGITLHVENIYGENTHHIVESCYKGLARALRQAIEIDPRKSDAVPSTKGVL